MALASKNNGHGVLKGEAKWQLEVVCTLEQVFFGEIL